MGCSARSYEGWNCVYRSVLNTTARVCMLFRYIRTLYPAQADIPARDDLGGDPPAGGPVRYTRHKGTPAVETRQYPEVAGPTQLQLAYLKAYISKKLRLVF